MFLLFLSHPLTKFGGGPKGPRYSCLGGGGDISSCYVQVLTFGVFVLCLYFSLFGFLYLAELGIFDNFPNWLINVLWFMVLDWLSSSLLCDLQKSLPRDMLPRHRFLSVMRLLLRESLYPNLWTLLLSFRLPVMLAHYTNLFCHRV